MKWGTGLVYWLQSSQGAMQEKKQQQKKQKQKKTWVEFGRLSE